MLKNVKGCIMNNLNKIIFTHFYIIITILFLSCGAKHYLKDEEIYKANNFSYNNLTNNGLIIGGISSQVIQLTNEERIEYSSILSNVLLEELKDVHKINIISSVQLIEKLGTANYFDIMENFDIGQELTIENIRFIGNSIPNIKYILLAYIENENIIDRSFDKYIEDEDGRKLETDYEKIYLLTIDFQIYDISQEKIVWNNVIYNEAERSETRTTETGCFESCMGGIIQTILFGPPAEINREEVIAKTVEKFAENLSKTKS